MTKLIGHSNEQTHGNSDGKLRTPADLNALTAMGSVVIGLVSAVEFRSETRTASWTDAASLFAAAC